MWYDREASGLPGGESAVEDFGGDSGGSEHPPHAGGGEDALTVVADKVVVAADAHALEDVLEGLGGEHGVGKAGGVVGSFGVKADDSGTGDALGAGIGINLSAEDVDEYHVIAVGGQPFH